MQPESVEQPRRSWAALVLAIALLAVAATLLLAQPGGGERGAAPSQMLQVAPGGEVELASLPHEHQRLYRAAADDPEAFAQVVCYCGCEAFLEHRHLLDCFVRPQGGWERHATGCAVCLSEARDVAGWRAEGVPLDEITDRIDERYGAITGPAA